MHDIDLFHVKHHPHHSSSQCQPSPIYTTSPYIIVRLYNPTLIYAPCLQYPCHTALHHCFIRVNPMPLKRVRTASERFYSLPLPCPSKIKIAQPTRFRGFTLTKLAQSLLRACAHVHTHTHTACLGLSFHRKPLWLTRIFIYAPIKSHNNKNKSSST